MVFSFFKRKKKIEDTNVVENEQNISNEDLVLDGEERPIENTTPDNVMRHEAEDKPSVVIDEIVLEDVNTSNQTQDEIITKIEESITQAEVIVESEAPVIETRDTVIDIPEEVQGEIILHHDLIEEDVAEPIIEEVLVEAELPSTEIVVNEDVSNEKQKSSWLNRLKSGLSKTRNSLGKKFLGVFGGGKIDEALYEELETILLSSDIGYSATTELLDQIRRRVTIKGLKDSSELQVVLKECIIELLEPINIPLDVSNHKPFVIMMVGVNGAGKTTSIGKLAKYFQSQGKSVMLAAGDTFRAAAREQLLEWGRRNNVTVVSQASGDSAAVCFDAIQSAKANNIDIVLADTAGRLPTQLNLMEEIKKVKRVIGKALDGAPHEVLLVLDSNIGQNAINQVKAFDDALGLTGLVLTKLDGTAKGGVICAIARERPVPLRFIGVGESIDDLRPFDANDYTNALFE